MTENKKRSKLRTYFWKRMLPPFCLYFLMAVSFAQAAMHVCLSTVETLVMVIVVSSKRCVVDVKELLQRCKKDLRVEDGKVCEKDIAFEKSVDG